MADSHNIQIDQGSVFDLDLTYEDDNGDPVDLTGYSARMQVRPNHASDTKLLDLTSGEEITLGGEDGTISVHVTATVTATLSAGQARYDLEVVPEADNDQAIRLVEGSVTITPEVTR